MDRLGHHSVRLLRLLLVPPALPLRRHHPQEVPGLDAVPGQPARVRQHVRGARLERPRAERVAGGGGERHQRQLRLPRQLEPGGHVHPVPVAPGRRHRPDGRLQPGHSVHRRQHRQQRVAHLLRCDERREDSWSYVGLRVGVLLHSALRGPLPGPQHHPE